jgi:hypothetical protein
MFTRFCLCSGMKKLVQISSIAVLLVLFISLKVRNTILSQSNPVDESQQVLVDSPGTIDGAMTPDLIPDDVAQRMFLLSIAEPPNPSSEQTERFLAKIKRLNFDAKAASILLGESGKFITVWNQTYAAAKTSNQDEAWMEQIVSDSMSNLSLRLSPQDYDKLRFHIQHIKTQIKMIPDPPM